MHGRQLEYLVVLDRERHFGRAADACHVTQPTLSAGIRALETSLGVPLVRRGHRFEGLTPEGERVLRWAQRIVADHRNLTADAERMRGDGVGVLRIGAIPTALPVIAHLTSPFLALHPDTRIRGPLADLARDRARARHLRPRRRRDLPGRRAARRRPHLAALSRALPAGDGGRRPVRRPRQRPLGRAGRRSAVPADPGHAEPADPRRPLRRRRGDAGRRPRGRTR